VVEGERWLREEVVSDWRYAVGNIGWMRNVMVFLWDIWWRYLGS
jgi:hypothetical protein